jgi:hypothetical protein
MTKVIINQCWGGFGLSDAAFEWLIKEKKWKTTKYDKKGAYCDKTADIVIGDKKDTYYIKYNLVGYNSDKEIRTNPDLIECVETLGSEIASGELGCLKIIEVPDDEDWYIHDYDGMEDVRTGDIYS